MVGTYDACNCTYSCKDSPALGFHSISAENAFKTNDFIRDEYRTFTVQFSYRKMKTCFFVRIISKNIAFNKTLRWGILCLFSFSGNSQTILKPVHRQYFLPPSIPAETIFLTCFNFWINNLCSATCYISARAFSLFQTA